MCACVHAHLHASGRDFACMCVLCGGGGASPFQNRFDLTLSYFALVFLLHLDLVSGVLLHLDLVSGVLLHFYLVSVSHLTLSYLLSVSSIPCIYLSDPKASSCTAGAKPLNGGSVKINSGTCATDDSASDVRVGNGKDDVVGLQMVVQAKDVTELSKSNDVGVQTIKTYVRRDKVGTSRHVTSRHVTTVCMSMLRTVLHVSFSLFLSLPSPLPPNFLFPPPP